MNLFEDLGSRVVYSIQLKQHSSYAAACPQINGPTPLLVEGRVRGRRRRLKAVRGRASSLTVMLLCAAFTFSAVCRYRPNEAFRVRQGAKNSTGKGRQVIGIRSFGLFDF